MSTIGEAWQGSIEMQIERRGLLKGLGALFIDEVFLNA